VLGEDDGLKGRAARAGEPVLALDPAALTQRIAVMPFRAGSVRRQGCHFYFARRVTFQPCADSTVMRVDLCWTRPILCPSSSPAAVVTRDDTAGSHPRPT